MKRPSLSLKKVAVFIGFSFVLFGVKWALPSVQYAASSLLLPLSSLTAKKEVVFLKKAKDLEIQNTHLKEKLALYEKLIEQDCHLIAKMAANFGLQEDETKQARLFSLSRILNELALATPARVIYRSQEAWTNTLWIDLGYEHNEKKHAPLISENSPVVLGSSLVGLVEYVGKKQSRVRLITDSALTPSVRALREETGSERLAEQAQALLSQLTLKSSFFSSAEEKEEIIASLTHLKNKLVAGASSLYLAKGEVRGSGAPIGRSSSNTLYGSGFHYDFADEEGLARDLRTGKSAKDYLSKELALVQEGDVLITTGYDGVFPKGLFVGVVQRVFPLEEGDYSYKLTAKPCVEHLEELPLVFVLPAQQYDPSDQPKAYPWL